MIEYFIEKAKIETSDPSKKIVDGKTFYYMTPYFALMYGPVMKKIDTIITKVDDIQRNHYVNVAKILEYKLTKVGDTVDYGYVLQEEAVGKPLYKKLSKIKDVNPAVQEAKILRMLKESIFDISCEAQEHYNKMIQDFYVLKENGIMLDLTKTSSLFCDYRHGFTFARFACDSVKIEEGNDYNLFMTALCNPHLSKYINKLDDATLRDLLKINRKLYTAFKKNDRLTDNYTSDCRRYNNMFESKIREEEKLDDIAIRIRKGLKTD